MCNERLFQDRCPLERRSADEGRGEGCSCDAGHGAAFEPGSVTAPDVRHDLSEAETRKLCIDAYFEEAGWKVSTVKGELVPGGASIGICGDSKTPPCAWRLWLVSSESPFPRHEIGAQKPRKSGLHI